MAKPQKPPPPEETDLIKAERRETAARANLAILGGARNPTMQAIMRYFSTYAMNPRPDLFLNVLQSIHDLNLMILPEHRNGVAGAVSAVYSLHPEHHDAWKGATFVLARILSAADRLTPPIMDEEIARPGQVDFLWMVWAVTRDGASLQRVLNLAHRVDSVGDAALTLLHAHAHLPDIQGVLGQALEKRQMKAMPHYQGVVRIDGVPTEDVHDLTALLAADPIKAKRIVLVGWLKHDENAPKSSTNGHKKKPMKTAQKSAQKSAPEPAAEPAAEPPLTGSFIVVTTDGMRPSECPNEWRKRPVRVRKATAEEVQAHKLLLEAAEEP